jgi:SAM-dependent methyltransferase
MPLDVVDLRTFYAQPLGTIARRFVSRAIRTRWSNVTGDRMIGLGYPTPYLGVFREEAERTLAFMPETQGVMYWPTRGPSMAALVDAAELPLPDASVDRVLCVHLIEMSPDPALVLREVWRSLTAGGRLLAVVPNRTGLWARIDSTPFGQGRPYSKSQIVHLLRETWFTPVGWSEALYLPPAPRGLLLRSATAWERVGASMGLPFAGVHIVEATKQVYRPISVRKARLEPSLVPAFGPAAAGARVSTGDVVQRENTPPAPAR